ncbi:hypothetical protein BD560DRAFT_411917 [Blakeslea trispora]|nr:hypothetical protein BD560DRAFT_411917 [Blakeslea trispora]
MKKAGLMLQSLLLLSRSRWASWALNSNSYNLLEPFRLPFFFRLSAFAKEEKKEGVSFVSIAYLRAQLSYTSTFAVDMEHSIRPKSRE